ncbi:MAG: class I SAM-dependent rRNA methyltransferase [Spirochaetales bacterium]|nr:class I SAM-dependent rRNA methyltransferase [Spirochaetales bacterium]
MAWPCLLTAGLRPTRVSGSGGPVLEGPGGGVSGGPLYPCLRLKPGREFPLLAGHPWVFGGGVSSAPDCASGALVEVLSSAGDFIGCATFHPANTIRARMLSRERVAVDGDFFRRRFAVLYKEKNSLLPPGTDGFRLVHADADFLPGLVVDLYGKTAVFQFHTAGMEGFRKIIVEALWGMGGRGGAERGEGTEGAGGPVCISCVVERSDVDARLKEGLKKRPAEIHSGEVSCPAAFREAGLLMYADVLSGQKTGFFLDQRDARIWVRAAARGRRVLNLFSYTGAFGLAAASGGAATVLNVDVSEGALELGRRIFAENGFSGGEGCSARFEAADVFDYIEAEKGALRDFLRGGLLVCDPPAFAKSVSHLEQAKKAYARLNRLCFELLSPGALFVTSSCSAVLGSDDFMAVLRTAAGRAGRRARVLALLSQPADHTSLLAFPEGPYLKTCALEIVE